MPVDVKYLHQAMKFFLNESAYNSCNKGSLQTPLHYGKICGNSMQPLLHDGQNVVVDFNITNLSIGKCYVFIKDDKLILHRLVWNNQRFALFIGDNSRSIEKVFLSDIVARLIIHGELIVHRYLIVAINILCSIVQKMPLSCQLLFTLRRIFLRVFLQGVYAYEKSVYQA